MTTARMVAAVRGMTAVRLLLKDSWRHRYLGVCSINVWQLRTLNVEGWGRPCSTQGITHLPPTPGSHFCRRYMHVKQQLVLNLFGNVYPVYFIRFSMGKHSFGSGNVSIRTGYQ